jgi:hypothetical protein
MLKRWEPAELSGPDGLGDECEAFLAGEWAEYRAAHGKAVPQWAWLNRVTHAPETALRLAMRAPGWGHRPIDDWTRLRLCVVEALLEQAAKKTTSVAELQRAALVPLELALFGDEEASRLNDAELLARGLAALRHPSGNPGPH